MKKKIVLLLTTVVLCFGLAACGSKAEEPQTEETQTQTDADSVETIVPEASEDVATDPVIDVEENSKEAIDEEFAVDMEPAATFEEFGQQIKDAIAGKNIEALAGLVAYPVYVGDSTKAGDGNEIETRDDFMALGVNAVITDDMVTAMDAVDPSTLVESKAGFTMMNGAEGPSITFKQIDGVFGIVGINY